MSLSTYFLLLLHFILLPCLIPPTSAQFAFLYSWCSNTTYTPNSTYQSNLEQVLTSITSNTRITYGFYNFTAGHEYPDKVYATALCRGDVPVGTCRVCLRDSSAALPLACPNNTEALGYTDNCILFVSNNGSTFHHMRSRPAWTLCNNLNETGKILGFNQSIYGLMEKLQNRAALGNSELKYATGKVNLTGNGTLYGHVQCTPDLSRLDCVNCVQRLLVVFPIFVTMPNFMAAGARTISPTCNIRYEIYPFYGNVTDIASPPAPPPRLPPQSSSNSSTTSSEVRKSTKSLKSFVIAIPIAGSLAIIIMALICILLRRKKQGKSRTKFKKEEIDTLQSLQYSFGAIKVATGDFSNENKLGEGGFGTVYKGKLPDGQEIAVKRLSRNSGQGDVQFKNEILILAKLQHRNLVRLLGFCLEEEEMILIYEFLTNTSLDNFIFDPVHRASMRWETRYKIIEGIARGLLYLHEDSRLRIIHRDLKAGNVLLDADFNPKIADFGMARLFNIDQTQAVASRIVGTYGYMPPEYVLQGHVSTKLDVFSFGVLILEIISGQMISSFQIGENQENLLTFAWKNWLEGTPWNLVDPSLSTASSSEILRCIHIGLLCVQHNLAERPTMSSVDLMLSSNTLSLQVPSQPAFFTRSRTPSSVPPQGNTSYQSSSMSTGYSINEVSITEPYGR